VKVTDVSGFGVAAIAGDAPVVASAATMTAEAPRTQILDFLMVPPARPGGPRLFGKRRLPDYPASQPYYYSE